MFLERAALVLFLSEIEVAVFWWKISKVRSLTEDGNICAAAEENARRLCSDDRDPNAVMVVDVPAGDPFSDAAENNIC